MTMKKLLCLLLALLMVFSLAACGGSDNSGDDDDDDDSVGGKDPTQTTAPEDDTIWLLVQESDMGSSRYTKYSYDENGNLIGGEFFKDYEKWGDYQYVTTETASGGKIVEELYKHVKDSEFTKHNEYEFDAAGRLIRTVDYDSFKNEPSGWVYTFTYNDAGQLVKQVSEKNGEMMEKLTFIYQGDKLMEGHYEENDGTYGHYLYTYDEEGNPAKVDVHTYNMQEQEYTVEFNIDQNSYSWEMRATDDAPTPMDGRRLFYYSVSDEDGKPAYVTVQVKTWGIFCTGWVPLVSLGCINPSNYFIGAAELQYMSLDAYLAEQAAE